MPKKESESSIFNEITRVIEMVIAYFRHHPATAINLYANEMHTCGFCAGLVWITIILTLDSYFAGMPRLLLLLQNVETAESIFIGISHHFKRMIHAIEPTEAKNVSFECNRPFISDLIIQEKSVGDTAAAAAKKIV